ncbi:tetratricopeptide repeat protein [Clostridium psychrophilum]|uniref:tetratricopeptide repeat protein n=1 Tax=Clostridium psychrophilum TaxID=132926 RepID=UPI001C0DD89E|nr:tetratricopeptide repeat protein [Clostridium psychrophilum]MBU3182458.1 tetratricopeptide repeat protein [Clostridium psychrophilum]
MLEKLSNIYLEEGLKNLYQNRLSSAKINFQKAFDISNENWEALNLLGLCLYTLGNFKKAEGLWKKSIYLNPKEENRAYHYIESFKENEFILLCDLYNKALLCANDGDFKRSEKFLKKEPYMNCNIIPFINLKGLCMFKLGKKGVAVSLWKQALLIDVENQDALKYIISSNDGQGEKITFNYLMRKILKIS